MTNNYERIKAMSMDEMARFLSNKMDCCVCLAYELHKCKATVSTEQAECIEYQKQWLESEAENER